MKDEGISEGDRGAVYSKRKEAPQKGVNSFFLWDGGRGGKRKRGWKSYARKREKGALTRSHFWRKEKS